MRLSRAVRRTVSLVVAGFVGLVASLVIATPASANVIVQNDGATTCLVTGGYAMPYHIGTTDSFARRLTGVTTNPEFPQTLDTLTGSVLAPGSDLFFLQLAPAGTTAASFTVTWERVDDPSVTGSFTGTAIQEFPECEPGVSAEVTATCDETATVELTNTTDLAVVFLVSGAEEEVAASSTKTLTDVPTESGELAVDVINGNSTIPVARFLWTEPSGCSTSTSTSTSTTTSTSMSSTASGLAVTGRSLTGVIAAGAGLVALGAALLVVLGIRRRRADAS